MSDTTAISKLNPYRGMRGGCLLFTWAAAAHDGAGSIRGLQDLQGQTVSVELRHVMPEILQIKFPGIDLLVTNNFLSDLGAVSKDHAALYLGGSANYNYLKALPSERVEARS